MAAVLKDYESQIETLTTESEMLKKEKVEYQEEMVDLKEKYEILQKHIDTLKTQEIRKGSALSEVERELDKCRNFVKEQAAENQSLQKRMQQLNHEVGCLKEDLRTNKAELERSNRKASDMQFSIEKLQIENEKRKVYSLELEQKSSMLNRHIEEMKQKIDAKEKRTQSLEQELTQAKNHTDQTHSLERDKAILLDRWIS